MSRLIDANEVVKAILVERDKIPRTISTAPYELGTEKPYHAGDQMRGGIRKALRCIEQAPTVDAVPVVHGRWITTSGEVFPGASQFVCYSHKHEECGFQYVDMSENEYDYCPNCGCRMDLEG